MQIDGKDYPADNLYRAGETNEYTITDLQPGQHTIKIAATNGDITETSFTLSANYNMTVEVPRNGKPIITEQRNSEVDTDPRTTMKEADFGALMKTLRGIEYTSQKEFAVTEIFLNSNYYFTHLQVIELLHQVTDANLKLAKLSYASLLDHSSFTKVINDFSDPEDKKKLLVYANRFRQSQAATHMTSQRFSEIKNSIAAERLVLERDKATMYAFTKAGNRFSVDQARQLIEISETEKGREDLAKASFRTLTNPEEFTSLYSLFNLQASKDSLAIFLFRMGRDMLSREPNFQQAEMSAPDFSSVIDEVSIAVEDKRTQMLLVQFANPYASFSTSQIGKLIELVKDEPNRLLLLMAAYRITTNRKDFSSLHKLLRSEGSRKALANYETHYYGK